MNAKIQRICNEIEKSRGKIAAEQVRLRELEKQKTEFENLEIVNAVRGMNISFADLAEMLKQAKPNTLATLATSGQVAPKSTETIPNAPSDNDEEDNE